MQSMIHDCIYQILISSSYIQFRCLPIFAELDFNQGVNLHRIIVSKMMIGLSNYLFGNYRCEICSRLTITTPERRQWRRSGVFVLNFEFISHFILMFLLLTLNKQLPAGRNETREKSFILLMTTSSKSKLNIFKRSVTTENH